MIFVGDDWAEDHHDIHLMDSDGARLASRRLPEGLTGIRQLHELIAEHAEEPDQVVIGIETDRGLLQDRVETGRRESGVTSGSRAAHGAGLSDFGVVETVGAIERVVTSEQSRHALAVGGDECVSVGRVVLDGP